MSRNADILIVDDEQVVIDAVKKICSLEKINVDTSLDVSDAVKKISGTKYNLIVCDIMMPEVDGFQFLDLLVQKKIDTPVVMTTGYSTVENAVKSLYKGAIDFIPKPFTADEMLNAILRGLRYAEIQKMISANRTNQDDTIIYVPCPAKYSRLGYSSWVSVERDGTALIGLTDLYTKIISSLKEIELFRIEEEIVQGNTCAIITDINELNHPVLSPITGRIIERNEEVTKEASVIEKDPYFKGWLYRIIPSDVEYELKNLVPCSSDRL
ncbi:MAG: response regulator [Ignavibacteriales bacterium]|nr:MAG: response regulator [Ignavibacteriales bacterium]